MESGSSQRAGRQLVVLLTSSRPSRTLSSELSSFETSSFLSSRNDCSSRGSFITSSRHRPPSSIAKVPGLNIPKTWNRPCRTLICY